MGGILLAEEDSIDDDDDDDVMISSSSDDDDDDSINDAERDDKLGKSQHDVANKAVVLIIWGSIDKQKRVLKAMMEKADDEDTRSKKRNAVALHQ
jgi:hypothetical protein